MRPGDRMMPWAARGLSRGGAGAFRQRLLTGLALAGAAAMLITVVTITDRGPGVDNPPGDVVRVGVVEGQPVPAYLRSSRGELAALLPSSGSPVAGETWALVSLAAYYPPDRLPGVLDGAAVAQVYARAPLPDVRTQVVKISVYRMPQDVVSGMLDAALARDQEQADYRKLGGELKGDGVNEVRLRRAYDTAARTAAAEAAAYRSQCACVFAAVVRAAPVALNRLAERPEVRVVDPAPEVRRLDRTEFRPVLPETPDHPGPVPRSSPGRPVAPETLTPLPSSTGASVTSASSHGPIPGPAPSATAPEESAAVPSVPPAGPGPHVPASAPGASRSGSRR
ncbi:hypothetical protein ACPCHT_12205 [Nucisporomicrobium flavum]|jgi:hypothetical protein|uniref:hypothetical protein n=1 Tax=Nucisporomicrobium flavum TaxID=2785915 RepID=UPI0018F72707|nr:hypothetical protein [Nucisporomicrobium flavum]